MKKYFLISFLFVCLFGGYIFGQSSSQGTLSLNILGDGLIIGTPANINLGSVNPGGTAETTFDDYFWIEDLRGISTGHYTTIQCDGLYGPGGYVITGVQMIGSLIELIRGLSNQTSIYSNLSSRKDITIPQLYLYRNNNGTDPGFMNRYGNKPSIRVSVPINAPIGSYKGKITYTLYDMSFNY